VVGAGRFSQKAHSDNGSEEWPVGLANKAEWKRVVPHHNRQTVRSSHSRCLIWHCATIDLRSVPEFADRNSVVTNSNRVLMWKWLKSLIGSRVESKRLRQGGQSQAGRPQPSLSQPRPSSSSLGEVQHLLPLRWSLHFALSQGEWLELRERHRALHPEQTACGCPRRCRTNTLDELWEYDAQNSTKRLAGAHWLCPGCHWLKSPTWRLETWAKQRQGLLPPLRKPPHVIDCLGWSQMQVDALRQQDLEAAERQQAKLHKYRTQQARGQLIVSGTPWQRLAPAKRRALRLTGKTIVAPWDIDLSALTQLGYASHQIEYFTEKMLQLAKARMHAMDT